MLLKDFEKRTGTFVDPCGLFISKMYPFLGCSPDSISRDRSFLVEVKCPHSLKNTVPWDFSTLENKSAYFNEIIGYENLRTYVSTWYDHPHVDMCLFS